MSQRAVFRGLLLCILCIPVLVAGPVMAQTNGGTITFSPATVTVGVGETSAIVTAQIAFAPPYAYAGTNTLVFPYLPYGVTTQPATITFSTVAGQQSATVSFRLVVAPYAYPTNSEASANTSPSYAYGLLNFQITPLTVLPSSVGADTGSSTPTLTATISYGEVAPRVPQQLTFAGLPPGAAPMPSPVSFVPNPQLGYAVVPFQIDVDDSTPAGNYRVTVGSSPIATGTDTFVLTVYRSGALAVAMAQSSVQSCPGGVPVSNSVTVTPLDGYSGSPTVTFPALPTDLKITPSSIPLAEIPPPATVAFEVEVLAGALPGPRVVNVLARDPFGPSAATSFVVNVGAADFLPLVSPAEVSVESGGAPVSVTASLAPGSCSPPPTITVTPVGLPTGVTATPASASLVGPAYAPVVFTLAAGPSAPAGVVPVSFAFTPSTGDTKSIGVPVTVVRNGHLGISSERASMDLCPGGAAAPNTLTITSVDGYTGTPTVTFPDLPAGLTVSPATIPVPALPPTRVVSLSVAAAVGTPPGPLVVTALVSDPRGISASTTFTANVLPPDFTPIVPPGVTTLNAGGAPVSILAWLAPGDCAPTSSVTVTPTGMPPGVTVTPASAVIEAPVFASVPFSFQASAAAAPGPSLITFTFTPAVGTAKVAKTSITVCGPPGAPTSPTVFPKGNASGPVTATDSLDLFWSAPASGFPPTRYEWRINGGTWTAAAGLTASAPPRGAVDPVQLFVRAYACNPEKGPGPEGSSPVYSLAAPVASFSVPASVVAGKPATFTDPSSPQATSRLWFPGAGKAATTVQSPTITFPAAGPKVVVLVATNGSGSSTKSTTVNVLAASSVQAAGLAVRSFQREPDGRLALASVEVFPGTTLLLRRLGGEGEAVAYLRLVDGDGRTVVERRLVLAEGEEARHDLSAWGATGTFRVELVGPEGLDAAVEESPVRLGGPEAPPLPKRGISR